MPSSNVWSKSMVSATSRWITTLTLWKAPAKAPTAWGRDCWNTTAPFSTGSMVFWIAIRSSSSKTVEAGAVGWITACSHTRNSSPAPIRKNISVFLPSRQVHPQELFLLARRLVLSASRGRCRSGELQHGLGHAAAHPSERASCPLDAPVAAQVKEGIRVYKEIIRQHIPDAVPFSPLGMPDVTNATKPIALGIRSAKRSFLAVWRIDGDADVRLRVKTRRDSLSEGSWDCYPFIW